MCAVYERAVPGRQTPRAASGASLAPGCCTHHRKHASCIDTEFAHVQLLVSTQHLYHCTCRLHPYLKIAAYTDLPRFCLLWRRFLGAGCAMQSAGSESALAVWSLMALVRVYLIQSASTPSTLYSVSHTRSVTLPYTRENAEPGCPPDFPGEASCRMPAECSVLLAARQGA